MEWIGIGIMIAIGIYLAPLIITAVLGVVVIVVGGIASLFSK